MLNSAKCRRSFSPRAFVYRWRVYSITSMTDCWSNLRTYIITGLDLQRRSSIPLHKAHTLQVEVVWLCSHQAQIKDASSLVVT